ncbi:peptidase T [Pediococcus cellicola]|uniref:Peptidase T n=1 Tax=Pediococcus cellicola TaxID=319652 RepID=A0A0R2IRS8_9LACO|nr:peptidase T [Pediococcus cellicola]KRN64317.1 peptidase T [Pediococcus cellicola]GEL16109.1 peptidase T [Pediococcus cellicola]
MSEVNQTYIERLFLDYVKINTRSDPSSHTVPTTVGQVQLAQQVVTDLNRLGVQEVKYNKHNGYVTATLPSNSKRPISALGFIAHLDTADFSADHVKPQVHPDYDGKDVLLNADKHIVLKVNEFPHLKNFVGQRLITSDGTTLLGADDKAGVAALLGALEYLIQNPKIEHGPIRVAFGPDEEIGRGAKRFDAKGFGTDFAYTLDNGQPGQLEYETFNASEAAIEIEGTAVHPGDAYGLMVNAVTLANDIVSALPKDEVPEKSRNHEGFILVNHFEATVGHASLNLIIRDFDTPKFHQKEAMLKDIVTKINQRFDVPRVSLNLTEQYQNIGDEIRKTPYIVNLALDAYRKIGLTPDIQPFRGGTDGNAITAKGIPTPNLFNGGDNFHGPYEFVTTEAMALTAKTIVAIVQEHVDQFGHHDNRPL